MGLLTSLFGKKKQASLVPSQRSTPESQKALSYSDVTKIQDVEKRTQLMIEFAEKGEVDALCDMGRAYILGIGVQKNAGKAAELLTEAGQKGSREAVALLGQLYIKLAFLAGKQENPNMEDFWAFYHEGVGDLAFAASRGNLLAIDTITGTLDMGWNQGESGDMLRKDVYSILSGQLEALKQENTAETNFALGIFAIRGICMPQDLMLAKSYLSKSATQGCEKAKQELASPLLSDDED